MGHADALSRCPLPIAVQDPSPASQVLLIDDLELPLSATNVAMHSTKDPIISKVLDWVRRGWPGNGLPEYFLPYYRRRLELSELRNCLLWGNRVVVPPSLRTPVLQHLHLDHPGISRMKALGVWWPNCMQTLNSGWRPVPLVRSLDHPLQVLRRENGTCRGDCGPGFT